MIKIIYKKKISYLVKMKQPNNNIMIKMFKRKNL